MVMATYTRYNFSEEAVELTARAYKCVALLAETYVFVYLGMAVLAFPIFSHTVWTATIVAMLACFVGRAHIYIGSWLFNASRNGPDSMPKISKAYMFVMWFSGLRGGVAFALASVSYAKLDFPAQCGGKSTPDEGCEGMTDSLAMMQITLIIALFTIFVFGGAITDVAIKYDVLEDKKKKLERRVSVDNTWSRFNKGTLMPVLTFADEVPEHPERAQRFSAAMPNHPELEEPSALVANEAPPPYQSKTTSEVKKNMSEQELQEVLKGAVSAKEVTLDDKVDEVRLALPALSTRDVKKLLQESNENVHQAIILGQSRGFS